MTPTPFNTKTAGGNAGHNKLVYSKDLDYTYIMSPDGKKQLGGLEGDHTNNPLAMQPNVKDIMNIDDPQTLATGPNKIVQMGKDLAVNAASDVPLMIPGMGPIVGPLVRTGGSLLSGYMADRALNSEQHNQYQSMGNAGLNTIIGQALPWLLEKAQGGIPTLAKKSVTTSMREAEPTLTERTTTGSSSGESSGTSATERASSSTAKGTVASQSKSYATFPQEHLDSIDAIEKEIERLQSIDTSKFNKGALTQVDNAIQRNKDALDALQQAGQSSQYIRDTVGQNEGVFNSEGKSTTTRQGERSGTSQSISSGISTPGKSNTQSTTVTTGDTMAERVLEAIKEMHNHNTTQSGIIQKFLTRFIPQAVTEPAKLDK